MNKYFGLLLFMLIVGYANSQELLANAIAECHKLDKENKNLSGNRDGLD